MWVWEKSKGSNAQPKFRLCCNDGKVSIPNLQPPPEPIRSLLLSDTPEAREFHQNIRAYNNVFAFASLDVHIDEALARAVNGVYTFRINGTICHQIGPLLPEGGSAPAFAQIYIHDPLMQLHQRQQIFSDLNHVTLIQLQDMLHEVNPFAQTIQTAAERLRHEPGIDISIRISGESMRHRRQYNAPTCAEVAVIIPHDDQDANSLSTRDVVYITKEGRIKRINETYSSYDPLHYVLLFPRGELGWTVGIRHQSRVNMTEADRNENEDLIPDDSTELIILYTLYGHQRLYEAVVAISTNKSAAFT